MSKTIICYCPECKQNTLHEIYKVDGWGEKTGTIGLLAFGILTGGVGFFDIKKQCECLTCGKIIEL